ncbi:MAG TPA: alpha/beta hydrolase, partial [Xanthomonadales bacterium]|nr:alpha/beta hydrolase [Xanthomonadales bacterium]
ALAAHAASLPVWVGASMGGLVGLIAQAESRTPLFSTLVLVDITPRWEAKGVDRILSFLGAHPEGFASLAEAQRAIDAYLPHRAARGRSPERLAKLLVRHADGRFRWHWDPALLATVAPEAPTWTERLTRAARKLDIPVLLVSGGRSDVVSDATIAEFLALVPHAEHRRLDDATHMVVGDENDRFTATISAYLERTGRLAG